MRKNWIRAVIATSIVMVTAGVPILTRALEQGADEPVEGMTEYAGATYRHVAATGFEAALRNTIRTSRLETEKLRASGEDLREEETALANRRRLEETKLRVEVQVADLRERHFRETGQVSRAEAAALGAEAIRQSMRRSLSSGGEGGSR